MSVPKVEIVDLGPLGDWPIVRVKLPVVSLDDTTQQVTWDNIEREVGTELVTKALGPRP